MLTTKGVNYKLSPVNSNQCLAPILCVKYSDVFAQWSCAQVSFKYYQQVEPKHVSFCQLVVSPQSHNNPYMAPEKERHLYSYQIKSISNNSCYSSLWFRKSSISILKHVAEYKPVIQRHHSTRTFGKIQTNSKWQCSISRWVTLQFHRCSFSYCSHTHLRSIFHSTYTGCFIIMSSLFDFNTRLENIDACTS